MQFAQLDKGQEAAEVGVEKERKGQSLLWLWHLISQLGDAFLYITRIRRVAHINFQYYLAGFLAN